MFNIKTSSFFTFASTFFMFHSFFLTCRGEKDMKKKRRNEALKKKDPKGTTRLKRLYGTVDARASMRFFDTTIKYYHKFLRPDNVSKVKRCWNVMELPIIVLFSFFFLGKTDSRIMAKNEKKVSFLMAAESTLRISWPTTLMLLAFLRNLFFSLNLCSQKYLTRWPPHLL